MKTFLHAAIFGAAIAVLSPAAQASLWTFDYTATGIFAAGSQLDQYTGVLDVENNRVVGITGTSSSGAITKLIDAGGFGNDNLFSDTSPYLTQYGFSFLTDSGRSVELVYYQGQYYANSCIKGSCIGNTTLGTFVTAVAALDEPAASVPEPASLALVAMGFMGMGVARRCKVGPRPALTSV